MGKRERFYNIDFLRFLLAIVIICYHFLHAGPWSFFTGDFLGIRAVERFRIMTINGHLGVEMFFIISGFFLMYCSNFEESVLNFIKKRICRLYPLVLLFVLLSVIYNIFVFHIPNYFPYNQILRLLLLDNAGLQMTHSPLTWYVSVLFWVNIFYFYIFKNFSKKTTDLIVPIIVILGYSFLIHTHNGNISAGTNESFGFIFNTGILRGLAGTGFGTIVYKLYTIIKERVYKQTRVKYFLYTCAESILIYFVFNNILFHKLKYNSNFIIITAFAGLFILLLLKRGFISQLLNNKYLGYLGLYSYSIYIIHLFVQNYFKYFVLDSHFGIISKNIYLTIVLVTITCILAGIITYHLVERPLSKYLNKKLI